jgi:3-methyladenine DNA glycosylase Tag
MLSYAELHDKALMRFASDKELEEALPVPRSASGLKGRNDAFYLSELSRRVFRAGFRYSVVDAKWPGITGAFRGFDPVAVGMMSDEELEALMTDKRMIRHWRKIKATRVNAVFVLDIQREYGSMGAWLADWPADDIVGLWGEIKRRGMNMGGNSAPAFLRQVGKDTFLLTDDVVKVLIAHRVVDKRPTSRVALAKVQEQFNKWAADGKRPLCQVSRMVSYLAG